MLYISTSSEAKSHILSEIFPGIGSRVVTTVCGITHPEPEFTYATTDDSNVCAKCAGKVEVEETVDTEPEAVVDSDTEVEETKTKK